MSKLNEATNYFKNRTSFEIPVYDTEQFKTILRALEDNKIEYGRLEVLYDEVTQEQSNRIKELEAYVSVLLEDAVTPQIDELKIDLEDVNEKLNAIREIIEFGMLGNPNVPELYTKLIKKELDK